MCSFEPESHQDKNNEANNVFANKKLPPVNPNFQLLDPDILPKIFAGEVEVTLMSTLKIANTEISEYLTGVLKKWIRMDNIQVRSNRGFEIESINELMNEAEHRIGTAKRDLYENIGQLTLLTTGFYKDKKVDTSMYICLGQKSFFKAAKLDGTERQTSSDLLLEIGKNYSGISYVLGAIRRSLYKSPKLNRT